MTIQYTTSPLPTRSNISSFPLSPLHALYCFCLFFARLLFRSYTLWHTLLLASHTPSLFPSCRAARALSLPGGRTLSSQAVGLFPPRRQDSLFPGGTTLTSPAAGLSPDLPGGRTLSSPAAGLSPPRRQDSLLPGGRTLSSPAAGLSPPRRLDSHHPGGRTLSSPAAVLFPPRRQDSFLPGGRTLSGPNTGSCRPLLLASSPILGCYFISMVNPGSEGLVRVAVVGTFTSFSFIPLSTRHALHRCACHHVRPVGSIRKVVRLVTGPNEIAGRGSGGALKLPQRGLGQSPRS